MSDAFVTDAFETFLKRPTRENYRRARRLAMADCRLDPHSLQWAELSVLCEESRFQQLLELSDRMWPQWRLCPRFHLLVAYAAFCLGDLDEAELARFQYQTCLEGMLKSGEGTPQAPYEVLRICDEYDVLRALGRRSQLQRLIERDQRWLDVITCDDDTEIWFDAGLASGERPLARRFSPWIDRIPSQLSHHF